MRAFQRLQTPIGEAITVTVLVMIAYAGLRMSPTLAIGAFHDDAIYLALGKAIASGEGFRSIYAAGEPVHLKYPPGLPLIYAALWTLGGSLAVVATAARFLALMVCGATAGLLWWLARTKLQLQIGHAALWVMGTVRPGRDSPVVQSADRGAVLHARLGRGLAALLPVG